jgi:hypothetical protein
MSLPFLMGVFAMLLSLGFVSLEKARVAVSARHEVWKLRDDPDQQAATLTNKRVEPDNRPLSVTNFDSEEAGLVYGEVSGQVRLFSWLGGSVNPRGRAAVLAHTWDHSQVTDFDSRPDDPHLSILERMVGGSGQFSQFAVGLLGALSGSLELPNQGHIDQAGEERQRAEDQAREAREELVREIERLRNELNDLIRQRNELERTRDDKVRERDTKQRELDDLREQAENLDPVPQSILDRIRELQEAIDQLNREINNLNGQISEKNRQIEAKRRELRHAEDALARADDEISRLP